MLMWQQVKLGVERRCSGAAAAVLAANKVGLMEPTSGIYRPGECLFLK
jgi:hypothetical protein